MKQLSLLNQSSITAALRENIFKFYLNLRLKNVQTFLRLISILYFLFLLCFSFVSKLIILPLIVTTLLLSFLFVSYEMTLMLTSSTYDSNSDEFKCNALGYFKNHFINISNQILASVILIFLV